MVRKSASGALGPVTSEEIQQRRQRGALISSGQRLSHEELLKTLRRFGRTIGCKYHDFRSLEQEA